MIPSRVLRVRTEFRSPWERREAWRYQGPFKGGMLWTYGNMFPRSLLIFFTYVAFDEVVNHGPLKKYVWGEDHKEHDHHDDPGHAKEKETERTSIHQEGDSETLRLARAALHVETEGRS
ncbi:hypothetical protein BDY24DRAFT_382960 [Mrakia frigida]|uniref:uncharacterized protein n=1 Tax=Mrakia frigida TaxID=29902 RepID=UPI003FCC2730